MSWFAYAVACFALFISLAFILLSNPRICGSLTSMLSPIIMRSMLKPSMHRLLKRLKIAVTVEQLSLLRCRLWPQLPPPARRALALY